mmetsp:Transcript_362/g.838  ORF Transcript_362/g.838 Transcript_362/m.838 type:complete len:252 (+) Transcript_362:38-793(+)
MRVLSSIYLSSQREESGLLQTKQWACPDGEHNPCIQFFSAQNRFVRHSADVYMHAVLYVVEYVIRVQTTTRARRASSGIIVSIASSRTLMCPHRHACHAPPPCYLRAARDLLLKPCSFTPPRASHASASRSRLLAIDSQSSRSIRSHLPLSAFSMHGSRRGFFAGKAAAVSAAAALCASSSSIFADGVRSGGARGGQACWPRQSVGESERPQPRRVESAATSGLSAQPMGALTRAQCQRRRVHAAGRPQWQ